MASERLRDCVQKIAGHYATFATHKEDYDAQVKAEIYLLEYYQLAP